LKKFDSKDLTLILGVAMSAAGLWLLHPMAFYGGLAVFGILLIRRSVS